jgi:hypothetical protein
VRRRRRPRVDPLMPSPLLNYVHYMNTVQKVNSQVRAHHVRDIEAEKSDAQNTTV